ASDSNSDIQSARELNLLPSAQVQDDWCAKLIPMYNDLMDEFSAVDDLGQDLALPEIVVVGAQSAGKSSVLESLVRRQFLPRGDGLVTRCPIELRLYKTNSKKGMEWVEFGHDTATIKRKFPFDKVSVYSPNVVPLTVIDLPGIVKNKTGNQPDDIEQQINQLIFEYISKPSSIILAISAADNDLVTSESIKLAIDNRVDPKGERTLGVITKIDRTENDTKALTDLLTGKIIPLTYGYIAVRNASADDVKNGKSMDDVRREEVKVLKTKIPDLADKNGTELSSSGNLKDDHVILNELRGRIKFIFLNKLEKALAAIDPLEDVTNDEISKTILGSTAMESGLSVPEAAYQHIVKKQIRKLLQPCLECIRNVHKELQNTVQNCLDRDVSYRFPRLNKHLVGAVHKLLFDRLAKVIEMMEYHIEIESAFVTTSQQDFTKQMTDLMSKKNIMQRTIAQPVESMIFQDNKKSVNENAHSDSHQQSDMDRNAVGSSDFEKKDLNEKTAEQSKQTSTTEPDDIEIVRSLISSYFEIVRQSIRDFVPKLLSYSMIYYVCDNLLIFLNEELHTGDKIDDLVQVSDEAREERKYAQKRVEQLKKAEGIIKDFRKIGFNRQICKSFKMILRN
ncbi:Dynamin-1-like protein, partial [Pseudolycoriella hygida]